METGKNVKITVETIVEAPVEKVWECWTEPLHITKWNNATDDWHTPYAENDLRVGGRFISRMEARNGSFGFDFRGVYDGVELYKCITYTLEDGRKVSIAFESKGKDTKIIETFEAENIYPVEKQQTGWQAILDNFKRYVEQITN